MLLFLRGFAILSSVLVVSSHSLSALSIVSLTADLTFRPVDIDGLGSMENLQKITIQFSDPIDFMGGGDLFNYEVRTTDNPPNTLPVWHASLTELPVEWSPPLSSTTVNLWFVDTVNPLQYDTDYLLHIFYIADTQGNEYLESFPDYAFRVPTPTSVPDASGTFALLAPALIGLVAFRRRLKV